MSLPHLTVIAGCNGSGKSSFSKAVTTLNTPSFDYDKVFLKKYKSLIDSDLRVRMAHNLTWTEFENAINEAISLGIDFTYETNFNADPLHWPSFFKEHNYHLRLIFFCLNSIDEAKRRVQIRVENGGHYVPDEEIVSRYYSGFENLDKQ